MSEVCQTCGKEADRYTMRFFDGHTRISCFVCENPRHAGYDSAVNPYSDLIIEHVHDEDGKPLHVTSKRQLLEAEKRYKFRSLVAHADEAHFDIPPNVTPPSMFEAMSRVSDPKGRPRGQEKGWLYPEIAKSMLEEIKRKNINIDTW